MCGRRSMRTSDLKIGLSRRTLLLLSGCFIGLAGCFANVPHNVLPSPPSEEVRSQLGRFGMEVVGETPSDASSDSVLKRLNANHSGAAAGGAAASLCNASILVCGALVAGGAMYGLYGLASETPANTEQEAAAITKALGQPFI